MLDSGARKQSVDTNLLKQLYFRSMLCHLASLVGRAEAQAPFISALYSGKKGIKLNIYIYIYIYMVSRNTAISFLRKTSFKSSLFFCLLSL